MLQSQKEISGKIKNINEAASRAVVFIVGTRFPMRECDYDVAAHILNAERSVIGRKTRIDETASYRETMKIPVEDFDFAALKVAGVKTRHPRRQGGQRESFIDGASGAIHFYDCRRRIRARIPAGDRSVFGSKQEERRLPRSNFKCAGVVKDGPGGCSTRLPI